MLAVATGKVPSGQVSGGITYVNPSSQQTAPGGTQGIPTDGMSTGGSWATATDFLTWARWDIASWALLSSFEKRRSFQNIGDIWRGGDSCNDCKQDAGGYKDSCGYHDAESLKTNVGESMIQGVRRNYTDGKPILI